MPDLVLVAFISGVFALLAAIVSGIFLYFANRAKDEADNSQVQAHQAKSEADEVVVSLRALLDEVQQERAELKREHEADRIKIASLEAKVQSLETALMKERAENVSLRQENRRLWGRIGKLERQQKERKPQ